MIFIICTSPRRGTLERVKKKGEMFQIDYIETGLTGCHRLTRLGEGVTWSVIDL